MMKSATWRRSPNFSRSTPKPFAARIIRLYYGCARILTKKPHDQGIPVWFLTYPAAGERDEHRASPAEREGAVAQPRCSPRRHAPSRVGPRFRGVVGGTAVGDGGGPRGRGRGGCTPERACRPGF